MRVFGVQREGIRWRYRGSTGERIRDKIAASKRKGMWMGGVPPLGYDVANRRLVPNEREAKLIRHIFQRFVELGSSTALVKELKLNGATSKDWTTQDGKTRDGRPIDKGHIYKLLSNRTYLGEFLTWRWIRRRCGMSSGRESGSEVGTSPQFNMPLRSLSIRNRWYGSVGLGSNSQDSYH